MSLIPNGKGQICFGVLQLGVMRCLQPCDAWVLGRSLRREAMTGLGAVRPLSGGCSGAGGLWDTSQRNEVAVGEKSFLMERSGYTHSAWLCGSLVKQGVKQDITLRAFPPRGSKGPRSGTVPMGFPLRNPIPSAPAGHPRPSRLSPPTAATRRRGGPGPCSRLGERRGAGGGRLGGHRAPAPRRLHGPPQPPGGGGGLRTPPPRLPAPVAAGGGGAGPGAAARGRARRAAGRPRSP